MFHKIIDVAESLIQTRGYNAFSYRDIAKIVGVKTSSIHYHFPSKADLGEAVVKKHIDDLLEQLDELMSNTKMTCKKKLNLFFDGILAKTYLSDKKMCLGGMLASDTLTLPENIQSEVRIFFRRIEDWLKHLLEQGIEKKEFHVTERIEIEVAMILALLEGSLLLARLYKDEGRLLIARKQVLARLT